MHVVETSKPQNDKGFSKPQHNRDRYNNPVSFKNWRRPTIGGLLKWKFATPTEGNYLGNEEEVSIF
jgi:hypothetical protein